MAQSPDWDARTVGALAGRGAREPLAPYEPHPAGRAAATWPDATPRSLRATAADATRAATRVKGSLVLAALEHLRSQAGGLEPVLARLAPETAARLRAVMLPMDWVDLADYVALVRAAERERTHGEAVAAQLGRATAERELASTHRVFMQSATPALALERIPQLFRAYHSGGRVRVVRASTGGRRVEASELVPDTLAHALVLSGFYQRLLELAGGRDVRAPVVSCRERGDGATVTVLRWR